MILIRPATEGDAAFIGAYLRSDDEIEVRTSTGQPGKKVVPWAFDTARESYTIFGAPLGSPSPNPCAIFGVTDDPTREGYGIVWFLATNDIRLHGLSALKEATCWLDHMSRHYSLALHNMADERNRLHIRWAKLAGFQKGKIPLRHNGHRFIHIIRPIQRV